jgi:YVTN family beta-propeller protein
MSLRRFAFFVLVACSSSSSTPTTNPYPSHSGALALTKDGSELYVVNPDADSVSAINTASGKLDREILLAPAHPAVDGNGNYAPSVMPRNVALSPDGTTLYVTGERSGQLHIVNVASGTQQAVPVGSEPVGLVVSDDGGSVFVACSQDNTVVRVDAQTHAVATANVPTEPWALALSPDGKTLFATQFLTAAGLTAIDTASMNVISISPIPDIAPRGDKRLAHGQARGLYDIVARPGMTELWISHILLGTDTAQPDLDFESTVFPAITVMSSGGLVQQVMSINAQDVPGVNGAFGDIVSGPHAIAFTHDGDYALMVDDDSEDVLIVDARTHVEVGLVRPLPGHQPEGIVLSPDDKTAYIHERNTVDIAVLSLDRSSGTLVATLAGAPISAISSDPMPAQMRLGQHLFYSANTDEYPISKNHWVACASCHLEGRSDAVIWRFAQGPRDTPTNAGGLIGTGFLFRTADRTKVEDYWRTIDTEQGGSFDPNDPTDVTLLSAIALYVNYAIPFPIPPTTNLSLVTQGQSLFMSIGCASCHAGPRFTDSGSGNPTLNLSGPVVLHNVGTCDTSIYPDIPHTDIQGDPRDPCAYDTPSLRGVASTPPYMHDGRSPTIEDAVHVMYNAIPNTTPLDPSAEAALVEYLRSL